MKTIVKILMAAATALVLFAGLSQALAAHQYSDLTSEPKAELLRALNDVIPVYADATESVLREIDALPKGTVTETTRLSQIPIADLFERNAALLDKSALLGDRGFTEGRDDHDVAWLRSSLSGLRSLEVAARIAAGTPVGPVHDAAEQDINKYVTVLRFLNRSPVEYGVQAIVEPISRFYCNLDLSVERDPSDSGPTLTVDEVCD